MSHQTIPNQFASLWTRLGNEHASLPEHELIELEHQLFDLRARLMPQDLPVILAQTDDTKLVEREMISFVLSTPQDKHVPA